MTIASRASALALALGSLVALPLGRPPGHLGHLPTSSRHPLRHPAVLRPPSALRPFSPSGRAGAWRPYGRVIRGTAAVYETTLALPDNPAGVAGIAWMDMRLLRARLYSGSLSPGGLTWRYTAPISPHAARSLVCAFNGGYLLKDSEGGYYSEGKLVAPLRKGAASLVIYKDGKVALGAWGSGFSMSAQVASVRQNMRLLVDHGALVPGLSPSDTSVWGSSLGGIADQWRSGLGITASGALVYVAGVMNILDLARELQHAGAVRAMPLDMNPYWTVFSTYRPSAPGGAATPANGTDLLATMEQSPTRFFSPAYNRDFVALFAA
ncbi:MAG: phosphodiester glycosidase family protein [Actinomycetota bacterium]|nr:phosphodiester glycosidase family protein [Actinomycetota bacterium]